MTKHKQKTMAIRNQHARQSVNYTTEKIDGILYYFSVGSFQRKSVIYNAKQKLISGKIFAPKELIDSSISILVVCNEGGNYEFSQLIKKS
jgi:hypothetical protein